MMLRQAVVLALDSDQELTTTGYYATDLSNAVEQHNTEFPNETVIYVDWEQPILWHEAAATRPELVLKLFRTHGQREFLHQLHLALLNVDADYRRDNTGE